MERIKNHKVEKSSYTSFWGMISRECDEKGHWSIKFVWSRVLVFFSMLGVLGYIALTIAIFCFFKYYREYSDMTLLDAVKVPFARAEHREKMGNYNIEKAKQYMKEGKFREAYTGFFIGCQRAPKNLEGRKILAEFFQYMFRRPDRAIETLEFGLVYAVNDIQYIRSYIQLLMKQTEDARVISVGGKLLQMPELTNPEVKMYLAMAMATVYAYHGNYTKSKEYIYKYKMEKTLPGILRLSKDQWELGNRAEAIKILADNINYPSNKEAIYAQLVNYYIAMKDYETARKYSMLRSLENPFSMEQRMEYMTLRRKSGDSEGVKFDMELFFNNYQNDHKSMLYLANFAADIGDLVFMRRIYDLALRKDFPMAPYCLLLLETTITHGDYKSAVAFVEDIIKTKPKWKERHEDVILCLRAVSYYAVGNSNMAEILINEIVATKTISVKVLIATARMFEKLNASDVSLRILTRAVELYPKHQLALTRLIRAELTVGISTNLHTHVSKLLKMRRPPRELISEARINICSDKFIFASERDSIIKEIDVLMNNKEGKAFTDSDSMDEQDRLMDSSSF